MKKFSLILALVALIATLTIPAGAVPPPEPVTVTLTPYADVAPSHPYAKDIAAVTDLGLMSGDEDGNFQPDSYLTRAQLIAILHRCDLLRGDWQPQAGVLGYVVDIDPEAWYAGDLCWWYQLNNAAGRLPFLLDGNRFRPDVQADKMTVANLLSVFAECHGVPFAANSWATPEAADQLFPDLGNCSDYTKTALCVLGRYGAFAGNEYGPLQPDLGITRGEAARVFACFAMEILPGIVRTDYQAGYRNGDLADAVSFVLGTQRLAYGPRPVPPMPVEAKP